MQRSTLDLMAVAVGVAGSFTFVMASLAASEVLGDLPDGTPAGTQIATVGIGSAAWLISTAVLALAWIIVAVARTILRELGRPEEERRERIGW
jgi:hypothetical protein